MISCAYYRLPYQNHFIKLTQTKGLPTCYDTLAHLDNKVGFVVTPFKVDTQHPIVLISPDKIEKIDIISTDKMQLEDKLLTMPVAPYHARTIYGQDFRCFYRQLQCKRFAKIVLARSEDVFYQPPCNAEALFLDACRRYPRLCIMYVSTPFTGDWLMATPEILLDGNGVSWHTMALAGTIKRDAFQPDNTPMSTIRKSENTVYSASWSDKNKHEQKLVATYIQQCLQPFVKQLTMQGPYTVQAGNLLHLRSDFTFALNDIKKVGTLLEALHPTPAVCGLPKHEAQQFILENEHIHRGYYSGFAGWLNPKRETHLYVSLRCMQITNACYRLYAGGGLLSDSIEQQEWEETVAKMETMKKIIKHYQ